MSYNGSGTFNINSAGQPVVTGTTITSTAFNLLTADLATGLSTALTKDGQSTPTANIPMGTFKITGLGAGTAATDAAQYGQLQAGATTIAVVTGTDTLTGTLTPAITAYATGNLFSFVAANTNTGAATIALNGLAAKNITKTGSTALAAGDIVSGRVYLIEYDGTRFQLLNPSASSVASFSAGSTGFTPSSATTGAVTLAGTLATTNGGTGLTSYTANGVLYASSSSALTSGSALTFDGANIIVNATTPAYFTGTSNLAQVSINRSPSTGAIFNASQSAAYLNIDGASGGSSFQFVVASAANTQPSEGMRLNSTGLGIGTSSPISKLANTSSNIADAAGLTAGTSAVQWSTSVQGYAAAFSNTGAGSQFANGLLVKTTGTSNDADAIVNFESGGVNRLKLTGAGNLALGVTPSAWFTSNNLKAFQLGGGSFVSYLNNQVWLASNYYLNSSGADTYVGTGAANRLIMDGAYKFFTAPSGTAGNAITFTQAMTLDASGNLGVATTSPSTYGKLAVRGGITVSAGSTSLTGTSFFASDAANSSFWISHSSANVNLVSDSPLTFWGPSGSGVAERCRIDSSGNLLVGTTTAYARFVSVGGGVGSPAGAFLNNSSSQEVAGFLNQASGTSTLLTFFSGSFATQVGSVSTNGSLTLYNTTSDQRLKENITDAESASGLIDSLQVRQFDWKADNSHQRYGFVAQELVTVAPEAVHQPADPDEMMAVDYSKLVPMLVKEIQSLRKRLADAGL